MSLEEYKTWQLCSQFARQALPEPLISYLVDRESGKDREKSPKIQTKDFPGSSQEAGASGGWGLGVSGTQCLGKWF